MSNIRYFSTLFLCLFVFACSKGASPVDEALASKILHVGNEDNIADVDPHITTGMPEYRVQRAIFEGLIEKDPKTLELIPATAQSWEISEDGLTYTFKIRDNARWSNDRKITADDFVWSFERALLPSLANQYAYQVFVIENAEAFHRGEIKNFSEVGVKALDESTLLIKLRSSTPYFLDLLTHHSMYPVPKETVLEHGEMGERGTRWTRPENFVGNGPFVMSEWKPNQKLVVKKNPNYWDADRIHLNEVHYYPIQQQTTQERMYRAGQLHIIRQLPTSKLDTYRGTPDFRSFPNFATYFYRFNTAVKPLDDVRVRKALAISIDRESIVTKVVKGEQKAKYNLTPDMENFFVPSAKLEYNLEAARELLAEAGFPKGQGFPSLTILYNTHEDHKKIALAIQQMWKNELGINIQLENQDWKVFLDAQRTKSFEIVRGSWVGDYYDPNTFLDMWVTNGGNNHTSWSNLEYDDVISKAASASTHEERVSYFQRAEAILVEEVPIIPIYVYQWNQLIHPTVKNWHTNIMEYWSFKDIKLER